MEIPDLDSCTIRVAYVGKVEFPDFIVQKRKFRICWFFVSGFRRPKLEFPDFVVQALTSGLACFGFPESIGNFAFAESLVSNLGLPELLCSCHSYGLPMVLDDWHGPASKPDGSFTDAALEAVRDRVISALLRGEAELGPMHACSSKTLKRKYETKEDVMSRYPLFMTTE